ncbi:NAD(P)H-dependent oxidoreductase [Candidatus Dependentiae bacterium]|nr:NAD(P)H-dependent oxidoreductase [Candidatus Dependentiae bacterium]
MKKIIVFCAFIALFSHQPFSFGKTMPTILLVLGSERKGRMAEPLSQAIAAIVDRSKVNVRIIDLQEYSLPFIDLHNPQRTGTMEKWAAEVRDADALILLIPNYNDGYSSVIKNAIDVLVDEGKNKIAGLVSYAGGYGSTNPITTLTPCLKSIGIEPLADSYVVIPFISSALASDNTFKKNEVSDEIKKMLLDMYKKLGVA